MKKPDILSSLLRSGHAAGLLQTPLLHVMYSTHTWRPLSQPAIQRQVIALSFHSYHVMRSACAAMQCVDPDSPEARRMVLGHTTISDLTKRVSATSDPDPALLAALAGGEGAPLDLTEAKGNALAGQQQPLACMRSDASRIMWTQATQCGAFLLVMPCSSS